MKNMLMILPMAALVAASFAQEAAKPAAGSGAPLTAEQKAADISTLLSGVQHGQSLGLLLVMTVLPCVLMFLSYILYQRKYKLDEAEYSRICAELEQRKA